MADDPQISHANAFVTTDKIRYSDTDRQGHVNNAVFATFLETGRVEILYAGETQAYRRGSSFVIAALSLQYLGPLFWPGTVSIATAVTKIGTSSFHLSQTISQHDKIAATAQTVMVHVDNGSGKGTPLSSDMKDLLRQYLEPAA